MNQLIDEIPNISPQFRHLLKLQQVPPRKRNYLQDSAKYLPFHRWWEAVIFIACLLPYVVAFYCLVTGVRP